MTNDVLRKTEPAATLSTPTSSLSLKVQLKLQLVISFCSQKKRQSKFIVYILLVLKGRKNRSLHIYQNFSFFLLNMLLNFIWTNILM